MHWKTTAVLAALIAPAQANIIGILDSGTSSSIFDVTSQTGVASAIGVTTDYRLTGLSLGPHGLLYGYGVGTAGGTNPAFQGLVSISPTGQVAPLAGISGFGNGGPIEFKNGVLYGRSGTSLYLLPTGGGNASLIGSDATFLTNDLALAPDGTMYGVWGGNFPQGGLQTLNLANGDVTDAFTFTTLPQTGVAFAPDATLYAAGQCPGSPGLACLQTVNLSTGTSTKIGNGVSFSSFPTQIAFVGGLGQAWPILPSSAAPGIFVFQNAPRLRWFDPPFVSGFDYEMTSGSLFTHIVDFPDGFAGAFQVLVNGQSLGLFTSGMSVDFTVFPGGGVSAFSIRGINPLADAGNPAGFPLELDFNTTIADFRMTAVEASAVPEPATFLSAMAAVWWAATSLSRRRRD